MDRVNSILRRVRTRQQFQGHLQEYNNRIRARPWKNSELSRIFQTVTSRLWVSLSVEAMASRAGINQLKIAHLFSLIIWARDKIDKEHSSRIELIYFETQCVRDPSFGFHLYSNLLDMSLLLVERRAFHLSHAGWREPLTKRFVCWCLRQRQVVTHLFLSVPARPALSLRPMPMQYEFIYPRQIASTVCFVVFWWDMSRENLPLRTEKAEYRYTWTPNEG